MRGTACAGLGVAVAVKQLFALPDLARGCLHWASKACTGPAGAAERQPLERRPARTGNRAAAAQQPSTHAHALWVLLNSPLASPRATRRYPAQQGADRWFDADSEDRHWGQVFDTTEDRCGEFCAVALPCCGQPALLGRKVCPFRRPAAAAAGATAAFSNARFYATAC